jgi:hypothetical protein
MLGQLKREKTNFEFIILSFLRVCVHVFKKSGMIHIYGIDLEYWPGCLVLNFVLIGFKFRNLCIL